MQVAASFAGRVAFAVADADRDGRQLVDDFGRACVRVYVCVCVRARATCTLLMR